MDSSVSSRFTEWFIQNLSRFAEHKATDVEVNSQLIFDVMWFVFIDENKEGQAAGWKVWKREKGIISITYNGSVLNGLEEID